MTSAVLAGRNEVHHAHPHHRHWGGARVPLMPNPSSNPNPRRHHPAGGPNPIPSGSPPAPPRAVPAVAAAEPLPSSSGHVKFRPSEVTPAEARLPRAAHRRARPRPRFPLPHRLVAGRAAPAPGAWSPARRSSPFPPPVLVEAMRKRCADILMRLRRSKKSVWFNSPVDVEGLKLHDYRAIIRSPMDLGTVKQNLTAGRFPSHEAFAGDVRLTFNNALRYNPPDHHVHRYAGNLLASFEGMYKEAVSWFEQQRQQLEPPMQLDLPPPPPPPPQLPVSVPVQAPLRMGGKALKKNQRNSMMNGDAAAMNGHAIDVTIVPDDDDMVEVAVNPSVVVEIGESETDIPKKREMEAEDEYVDIGDEMPTVNYQSVEIERDSPAASSSSGSGSGSSSSSDSDSDSESDGDDASAPH
ncbi:unnamed protein product [Miscanthus lutarioriparius]|uniref:Bromo domain-containing protein n=1 Tax=Miscanthus lutarioriparius TaxID=422564 RepID=A0A811PHU9_9POAL|nr:unnamed protein product [Miscanthus lutarioriparius]